MSYVSTFLKLALYGDGTDLERCMVHLIQQIDIEKAIAKWDGTDGRVYWRHNDRQFFERLSVGSRLDREFVVAFAQRNSDCRAHMRTGGYSIMRVHWGGAAIWADKLNRYFASQEFDDLTNSAGSAEEPTAVINLVNQMANLIGTSKSGKHRKLGFSATSKWLFFRRPELPIFIYDKVAWEALFQAPFRGYRDWWNACARYYNPYRHSPPIAKKHLAEVKVTADWFSRRCLDFALYRKSQAGKSRCKKSGR